MTTTRTVRSYDYVNQPYARVRDALLANPVHVFRRATAAAVANDAVLRVSIAGVDLAAEVAIEVDGVEQDSTYGPVTLIRLRWQAVRNPNLYPTMVGSLGLFPLSPTETQLSFEGSYDPPLGKVGELFDAAIGHRIAETTVDRFMKEIAGWLREELWRTVAPPSAPAPSALQ